MCPWCNELILLKIAWHLMPMHFQNLPDASAEEMNLPKTK
jgi:hypothetical protein